MYFLFFFFQAEDGIRDIGVTGVQTCTLPIFVAAVAAESGQSQAAVNGVLDALFSTLAKSVAEGTKVTIPGWLAVEQTSRRSEERRVGKECRSRWSPYH